MRIMVTGSRDWTSMAKIDECLRSLIQHDTEHVLIHGKCPTGADALADRWWRDHMDPDTIIQFPALWRPGGPSGPLDKQAGIKRNKQMVIEGDPDVIQAFIRPCRKGNCQYRSQGVHGSHGTQHAMSLARVYQIPVFAEYDGFITDRR